MQEMATPLGTNLSLYAVRELPRVKIPKTSHVYCLINKLIGNKYWN